ncbi:MAG: Maltose or trehalose phosphorylase [Brockia lithotrophica]|uniref:Maltose or trehalose phosphorylase n=1 Tax=Brockia lithotrophica TaxID=933949 RepID=A0A2T5GA79_9BACL|nr:glycoside hydrolase family 65 protein [Brockia lithotrophica]PTQ53090.1 MAG: Maltose or trehalose phosphorylase [Brockia lithotrophica]
MEHVFPPRQTPSNPPLGLHPWKIVEGEDYFADREARGSLFALANGWLGVRGHLEEEECHGTFAREVYEIYPLRYPEGGYGYPVQGQAMVPLPEGTGLVLYLDDERVDLRRGEILAHVRELDFRSGTLVRTTHWRSQSGREIVFRTKRIVPFSPSNVLVVRLEVLAVKNVKRVRARSLLCGTVHPEADERDFRLGANLLGPLYQLIEEFLHDVGEVPEDVQTLPSVFELLEEERRAAGQRSEGGLVWRTRRSGHQVAAHVVHTALPEAKRRLSGESGGIEWSFAWENIEENQGILRTAAGNSPPIHLTKFVAYAVGSGDAEPKALREAARYAAWNALAMHSERLEEEQRAHLATFWQDATVHVEGDPYVQQGIHFSLFHLYQAAGPSPAWGIGAKGLTGPGYEGHVFWDMDVYVLPFFIFTHPHIARRLLEYRYRLLPYAQARARELGYPGILYPWRTIDGPECSAFFPAGTAQIHINAAIVYAFKKYRDVTGDETFFRAYGLEIAALAARFYAHRASAMPRRGGAYGFFTVTGPDEYTALVDNNAYTNAMAAFTLEFAAREVRRLAEEDREAFRLFAERTGVTLSEAETWLAIAENIYLPWDEREQIFAQDDSFLDKPRLLARDIPFERRPLLLHMHYLDIYRFQVAKQPDVLLWLYLFPRKFSPEEIRRHLAYYEPITVHDSSLSPSVFATLWARAGDVERAHAYLRYAARIDLENLHGDARHGVHLAAMGGVYQALLEGFGGIVADEEGLDVSPRLPRAWKNLAFRFRYRGRRFEVRATHERTDVHLLAGEPLSASVHGTRVELVPGKPQSIRRNW